MKNLRLLITPILLTALAIGMNSCFKEKFDFDRLSGEVHYEPSLAAPIAYGSLSMIDGLHTYDSLGRIVVNENDFLSLKYFEDAESDTVSHLMHIGNQHITSLTPATEVDFTGFNNSGDMLTVNKTIDMHFDLFNEDAELDSIWLDHGIMNLAATSTYQHAIQLSLTFPTVTKNGVPFSKVLNLLPYGSSDVSNDNSMIGYHVDLTQTALTYNEIPVELEIKFVHSGGNNTGTISLDLDLIGPDHEAMFGYFGHNTLIFESGKIKLDLFDPGDGWELEDFWFEDPKFKVYYTNSYGIPTNFYFDSVAAYSSYSDQLISILDYQDGLPMDSLTPHHMSYPSSFGSTIEDSLILDKNNSNISYVIQQRPSWIKFIAHAHTNPGDEAGHQNFVWDDSRFRANIEVEMPLWGYIDRFHGNDTSDFDLKKEFDNPDIIEKLFLRINIDNGLPIFIDAQVYMLDSSYTVIDSIIQTNDIRIIEGAETDNNGKVINKSGKTIDIVVTDERLDALMDTKYILYKASASTTNAVNDEKIKIYPEYEVDFDIAVEADLDIEINLDTIN